MLQALVTQNHLLSLSQKKAKEASELLNFTSSKNKLDAQGLSLPFIDSKAFQMLEGLHRVLHWLSLTFRVTYKEGIYFFLSATVFCIGQEGPV